MMFRGLSPTSSSDQQPQQTPLASNTVAAASYANSGPANGNGSNQLLAPMTSSPAPFTLPPLAPSQSLSNPLLATASSSSGAARRNPPRQPGSASVAQQYHAAAAAGSAINGAASRSGGGSMASLRTVADHEGSGTDLLSGAADIVEQDGEDLEMFGPGAQPILATPPHRDPSAHRTAFRQANGTGSATDHRQQLDAQVAERYDITHLNGHSLVGEDSQQANNLVSASRGANSQMIPMENAARGNPDLQSATSARVLPGTAAARQIDQRIMHDELPAVPLMEQTVYGDRPDMPRSEFDAQVAQYAPVAAASRADLTGAAHLMNFSSTLDTAHQLHSAAQQHANNNMDESND